MKLIPSLIFLALVSPGARAKSTRSERQIASKKELPQGSWTCIGENGQDMTPFYIRKDGTSAKVEVAGVKDNANNAECYDVSFKWLDSGKAENNLECCPTGMN